MAHTVSNLVNTSVDDCKTTIGHYTKKQLPLLRELLNECGKRGHKARYAVVRTRINKLIKETK